MVDQLLARLSELFLEFVSLLVFATVAANSPKIKDVVIVNQIEVSSMKKKSDLDLQ